ncbi:MAG: class I SAM-dependent methyltransferase [Bacteroidia bacterium]|jgi:predicted O-methyltransferase YrrM|nr:class I SAM-dependent methyltransferase [Bacteroidia bacterium]
MSDWILPAIETYAAQHTSTEPPVLKQLNRDTHANVLQPRMLSGHYQGRLLSMLSHMIAPNYILEIGTYTGYSAICLAEGLAQGGRLITIDVNAEREEMVNQYIEQAGFAHQIQHIIGDALRIIPTLPYTYDLVFIDADKPNYPAYYELALAKVRSGGFILLDNVLWSGKVADINERERDKDTALLHKLNLHIQSDDRVENVLLPLRDGLLLVRKR